MKIAQLSGVGKREHNEDSKLVLGSHNIYMVCDGVGGSARGEVASRLCCDTFLEFFTQPDISIDALRVQDAVVQTERAFEEYLVQHDEARGMATTLTFLCIQGNQAIIAHVGDSRVYHVRNGQILFSTTDHSLVSELLASGFITPEEAINHPKKNHITRAVQGSSSPTIADIQIIKDVQEGDFFLLCSDGVLESVSNDSIQELCLSQNTPDEIISNIKSLCISGSIDIILMASALMQLIQ